MPRESILEAGCSEHTGLLPVIFHNVQAGREAGAVTQTEAVRLSLISDLTNLHSDMSGNFSKASGLLCNNIDFCASDSRLMNEA